MAVNYSDAVKAARMAAVQSRFVAGGELEIVSIAGTVLACFKLARGGGRIDGDTWTLSFDVPEVVAEGSGIPAEARIKNARGEVEVGGLTPGEDFQIAYPDRAEALISAGQMVGIAAASIVHA